MASPTPPPTFNPYGTANRHVLSSQQVQAQPDEDIPAVANPEVLFASGRLRLGADGDTKAKKSAMTRAGKISLAVIIFLVVALIAAGGLLMIYGPQPPDTEALAVLTDISNLESFIL